MRLLSISAFYRNNRPDGFGFSLQNHSADLEFVLTTLKENYSQMWRDAAAEGSEDKLIQDLTLQLSECSRLKGRFLPTDPLVYIAIGNVWLLVELGELPEDEFNGLLLAYAE
jgi:hypothetical protein